MLKFKISVDKGRMASISSDQEQMFYVAISGYDSAIKSLLNDYGVDVESAYGNMAYCRVPESVIEDLCKKYWIKKIDVPRKLSLSMDIVRDSTGVTDLHNGFVFQGDVIPFTGKNVVVGIVDCGIAPNHISFRNRELDSFRVGRYSITRSGYESRTGGFDVVVYEGEEEVREAASEDLCGGHGTHVAGISSGADVGNGFYGIAPNSELVFTTMGDHIYEDEIMYGIQSAIDYADERGMPVVINLSLGSAIGPHDGSGIVSDYLSSIDDEGRIICFAAGNDGGQQISLSRNFNVDSTPMSSAFARRGYGTPPQSIYSQMWSLDDKEFEIAFHVVDIVNRDVLFTTPYLSRSLTEDATDNIFVLYSTTNPTTSAYPEMGEYFSGEVLFGTSVENERYVGEILTMFNNVDVETPYTLGFTIKSDSGASVIAISDFDCCYFRHYGLEKFENGNPDHSISDYCTSPYVVSVGSWNARREFVDKDGTVHMLNEDRFGSVEAISIYSSYGENVATGEMLPHIVAPGSDVISSLNINATGMDKATYVCSEFMFGEETYAYGNMTGTSMSTPVVTGILALWLEAKPDLTRDEILDVLCNSSRRDKYVDADYRKSGYGKIDAYAGLKYILTSLSTPQMTDGKNDFKVMLRYLSNHDIEIILTKSVERGRIELYNLVGNVIAEYKFSGNTIIAPLDCFAGYYLMKISTEYGDRVEKIYIK